MTATAKGTKSATVQLFTEISESPKTRAHVWTQGPWKASDVRELHSPEGCQMSGGSNGLLCTKGDGCFSQKKGEEGNCLAGNSSREILFLGSSCIWGAVGSGWGSCWNRPVAGVHNNRVCVICTVWPDLPCLLSCSHPGAISRIKLWTGRGEFLSNYENVSGRGIFTTAC